MCAKTRIASSRSPRPKFGAARTVNKPMPDVFPAHQVTAHADVSSSQTKRTLQALMTEAVKESDPVAMNNLYSLVAVEGNKLREQYGIPEHDVEYQGPLTTVAQQLQSAGVGHESCMGGAVLARSNARRNPAFGKPLTLFEQCFRSAELARAYQGRVAKIVAPRQREPGKLTVYPPLLVRGVQGGVVDTRVGGDEGGGGELANLMFVSFAEGPVVPVTCGTVTTHDLTETFKRVYGLTGKTDLAGLEKGVGVP